MRDSSSLHQKVQEMCDCYATNDPLKEMSKMQHEKDIDEAAVKWIALAILHGINNNAEEISIEHTKKGSVKVIAEYRRTELPPPDEAIAKNIVNTLKNIIHVEFSQGDSALALGLRSGSVDLHVKTRDESRDSSASIKFP